ncbi:MAG: exosortase-associated EpsI family protein, partial [Candidatus Omnitrophica bacterium]|nr:exosortase-associated EpsI family protein [Candidatus Omnitrophota bacterium]
MIDTRTFRKFLMLLLVGLAMAAAFLPKKTRYEGLNVLSEIRIPSEMPGWTSVDISDQIDVNQDVYNFISDVFARIYQNPYGEQVLLLVLDAGNFHNPKVCYTSSGYSVKEKESVTLSVDQTKIKANMLDIHRPDRAIFLFYW